MTIDALVAEIGSTTTLVNAFAGLGGDSPVFVAQGQAPTSVLAGDVRVGLRGAVDDLRQKLGVSELVYGEMFATSSAAGGLRMTVHGLVYDMTARAAREAALGAGANIHLVTSGRLRKNDLERIRKIRPNIIMVAGGVDHGERDTAAANALAIRGLGLTTPVIYAGNADAADELREIFGTGENAAQKLYVVENVYPRIDDLNVEPARRVIQNVFEEHIVQAPGMEHIRDMVQAAIIPTPGAVMEAAKLLYDGIGDLLTIDVGGATTDVHSVSSGSPEMARVMINPEPLAKRTVEGDLGVYINMNNVIDLVGGVDQLEKELGFDPKEVIASYQFVPANDRETRFVERLAKEAAVRAVERHAGRVRYIYGPTGRQSLAEGKDLTAVRYIVGTGGALTRLPARVNIMRSVAEHNETGLLLFPPRTCRILVDNDYIMASLSVLSKRFPDAALTLLKKSLHL